ncbi:hypothetical protein I307_05490 [Cryptococcus deuterogattii 99/473]|uniref:Uncharacterized protein n=1 Tax=Cryptococcus deuterogattii Ram5 TaxID=1296110 RepID=A0A0D0V071_9TREE|nr:hypothetical protein I313_04343 [Cryptococcus deuterogattii Ram5]KIY55206.1 hypothetical protein I307_05490 [Cryptococcus deuterogattii 99/473]
MAFAESRRWSGDAWSLWQDSKMEARAIKNGNVRIEAEERNRLDKFQGDKNALIEEIQRESILSLEDEDEEFAEEADASASQGSDKQTQRTSEVSGFQRTITSTVNLFALNEIVS